MKNKPVGLSGINSSSNESIMRLNFEKLADYEINRIKNKLYYLIHEINSFSKELKDTIKTVYKED